MIANLPPRVLQLLTAHQVKPAKRHAPLVPRIDATAIAYHPLTQKRILRYTDAVGFGLSDGRKRGAYRLACFYLRNVGLSFASAALCLAAWNDQNLPPLGDGAVAGILSNASKYARGAA